MGYVPDTKILQIILGNGDLEKVADALIAPANRVVKTVEQMGLYRGRPYRLQ